MTKRFVSWVAVSSRPQMDGGSPEDQRERNLAHIEKWNGVLVADLEVPGQSRSYIEYEEAKRNLEAYRQLDELIKAKAFDVLICYNVGRLARKRSLITTVIDLCHEAGIVVYRTSNPPTTLEWSLRGYSDMLVEAIESTSFQNEVDQLREHHRTGMLRRAQRGDFACHIPWGYKKVFDEQGNGRIEIDEDAAEIIRKLYELYLSGRGKKKVVESLNRLGYRPRGGGVWTVPCVDRVLRQVRIHAGYIEFNRLSKTREYFIAKGKHPAIIAEDTMNQVLGERADRSTAHRAVNTKYLFSRLVMCERCNFRMSVCKRIEIVQRSPELSADLYCPQCKRHISFSKVKTQFVEWFEQAADGIELEVVDVGTTDKMRATVSHIQKQIEAAEKAISRAHTAFVDGTMGDVEHKSQVKRKETERAQLSAQLDEATKNLRSTESHRQRVEQIADIVAIGKEMMNHPDAAAVNAWLREYFTVSFGENRRFHIRLK